MWTGNFNVWVWLANFLFSMVGFFIFTKLMDALVSSYTNLGRKMPKTTQLLRGKKTTQLLKIDILSAWIEKSSFEFRLICRVTFQTWVSFYLWRVISTSILFLGKSLYQWAHLVAYLIAFQVALEKMKLIYLVEVIFWRIRKYSSKRSW